MVKRCLSLSGKEALYLSFMLTALGDKHLISQYLLDGANDYIVKPFDLEEVYARVSVQLREHNHGSSVTENIYQVKILR